MKKNPTKIALVTGAARGIGRAIASEFLAAGYRVVAVDLRVSPLLQAFHASSDVSQPNAIVSRFQINVGAAHAFVIHTKS